MGDNNFSYGFMVGLTIGVIIVTLCWVYSDYHESTPQYTKEQYCVDNGWDYASDFCIGTGLGWTCEPFKCCAVTTHDTYTGCGNLIGERDWQHIKEVYEEGEEPCNYRGYIDECMKEVWENE